MCVPGDNLSCDYYARIVTAADGRPRLMRARDLAKELGDATRQSPGGTTTSNDSANSGGSSSALSSETSVVL